MQVYDNDAKIVQKAYNMINKSKNININAIRLCKKCIKNNLFDDAYKILDNVAKSIKITSEITTTLIDYYIDFREDETYY